MVQGVGVLVITNTVCGDEITAAPHSARWTLTQFYLVPGCCPASQHRPGSHQPRSLAVRTFSFPTGCHCHQPSVRPRSVPRRDHSRGRTAAAAPGPRRCQGTWHPQLEHAAAKISENNSASIAASWPVLCAILNLWWFMKYFSVVCFASQNFTYILIH